MSRWARSLILALAVAGCGSSTTNSASTTPRADSTPRTAPARARVLDMGCSGITSATTSRFLGGADWLRQAVNVGAITVVRGTRLVGDRTAPGTYVHKLPILVRPDVRASLELRLDHGRGGFFIRSGGGLVTAPPSKGQRRIFVGPCSPIPRDGQHETSATAMGLFITTTRPGCATLTVRWRHHRRTQRLRLGVRRCGARA